MSTAPNPTMPSDPTFGPTSSPSRVRRWLWWLAPLPVAVAAYWGYGQAADRWPGTGAAGAGGAAQKSASAAVGKRPADSPPGQAQVQGNAQANVPANAAATAQLNAQAQAQVKAATATRTKPRATSKPMAAVPGQPVPGALAVVSNEALKWPLWEFQLKQPVQPQNPPLTPPNWRLVGSANDGKVWQLVILRQGKPEPEFYKVGQELPGHYKIETITGEDVTLVQRGRRMVLSYIGY
jgi:hypothetical protein